MDLRTWNKNAGLVAAALVWTSITPSIAAAAPPVEDAPAWSRKLFKQAETLANDSRWSDACPFFQAAHDLHATGGTALRSADCYEKIAAYDKALAMYRYVVEHAASDTVPERVALAKGRVSALEKQLEGPPKEAPKTEAPPPPAPSRVPAIIAFSAGGAGAVLGAFFGGLALAEASAVKRDAEARCPTKACNDADLAARKGAAVTKAWVANVGLGVAVAGAAIGTVLLVTSSSGAPREAARALLRAAGPEGITVRF